MSQQNHSDHNESLSGGGRNSSLDKKSKTQSSSEKLHAILIEKSSSRIGRLNKNTQQIAINQLINEDMFTKDFK